MRRVGIGRDGALTASVKSVEMVDAGPSSFVLRYSRYRVDSLIL